MSDQQQDNGKIDPVVQPFVDFWTSYFAQANDVTGDLLNGVRDTTNIKSWQRNWLDAVSKSMDTYMRTPAFLQSMKHNTDLLVKAKQESNNLAAEFARNANIPTAADVSGLFERLHGIEQAILERLRGIEERIEKIEQNITLRHETSVRQ